MRQAQKEALEWIIANPGDFLGLTLQRIAYLWLGPLHRPRDALEDLSKDHNSATHCNSDSFDYIPTYLLYCRIHASLPSAHRLGPLYPSWRGCVGHDCKRE